MTTDWNPDWLAWDRQHIWHPYSSFDNPAPVFPVVSAEGVRLTLADGREIIDGMASWWSAIHGYNHPQLNQAATQQLSHMSHVMFGGLTHGPAIELSQKLVALTPAGLEKVFIADSGSVAVEVAIKMALQYWASKGKPEKHKLVALRNGYHGDTMGAMAACDPVTGMHHLFADILPTHHFVSAPGAKFAETPDSNDLSEYETLLAEHGHEIAALIVEPVVQGAGGMRFYSPTYLNAFRDLCNRYGVLLIFDEIATGFGRTGKMFAADHAGVCPDILCLGKALTGGYLSLAATLCTEDIASVISHGEAGAFMHGPTFMGNPLACAIANKSIELLLSQDWAANIARMETALRRELEPAKTLPGVRDVRVLGAIGVIELQEALDLRTEQEKFVNNGVWVRPFGKLVYTMPPYVMSDADIALLCAAMIKSIR